jgi:hypothetical protein
LQENPFRSPVRVSEANPHEKAVQLRFRQGVSARLFQRVLSGDDKKRFFQRPGFSLNGHLALFHGFQQGTLGFGRGPVDFVGEQHLGEDRPRVEDKPPGFLFEYGSPQDVPGKHVAGELDPTKIQPEAAGQHLGQGGLTDAGPVFYEQVPAGKQAGKRKPDLLILAQDDLSDTGDNGVELFFHSSINNNHLAVGQPAIVRGH